MFFRYPNPESEYWLYIIEVAINEKWTSTVTGHAFKPFFDEKL